MLNLLKIEPRILDHLVERLQDGNKAPTTQTLDAIRAYSWEMAFDEWCNYEGLINYGPRLRALMAELQGAEAVRR